MKRPSEYAGLKRDTMSKMHLTHRWVGWLGLMWLAGMPPVGMGPVGAADLPPTGVILSRLFYQDNQGRQIDYDFSAGGLDPNGVVRFPAGAVQSPASGATFHWQPGSDDIEFEQEAQGLRLWAEPADYRIPPIPTANIVVDGVAGDWDGVAVYIDDRMSYGEVTSTPGSDVEYVKLAFSGDEAYLNLLIKVSDIVSEDLWYRLFLEGSGDLISVVYGHYVFQIYHDSTLGWTVEAFQWNGAYGFARLYEAVEVAVSGAYLEARIDRSRLLLQDRFYVSGETLGVSPPGMIYGPDPLTWQRPAREKFLYSDQPLDSFEAPRRFPWAVSGLAGENNDPEPGDQWALEVRLEGFREVGRKQVYHHFALALSDPCVYEPTPAYLWCSWYSGKIVLQRQENLLFPGANVQGTIRVPVNGLADLDPNTTVLDLRLQVDEVSGLRYATALYRVDEGDWQTLAMRALLPEQMLGFPRFIPQVWMWSSLYDDLPDLTGAIEEDLLPEVLIPGNHYSLPVTVANQGDKNVNDYMTIYLYLSSDPVFDEGDLLITPYNYLPVWIAPDYELLYRVPTVIPPETAEGDYYLIAVIDAEDDIGELDETDSSNIAYSNQTISVSRRFGDLGTAGHRSVTVAMGRERQGRFSLSGGGWGQLESTSDPCIYTIRLYETTSRSTLTIKEKTAAGSFIIGDIIAEDGPLYGIEGSAVNLMGNIEINGTLNRLVLQDILPATAAAGHVLTIEAGPAPAAPWLQIQCRSIADLRISAAGMFIQSLQAVEWLDTDGVNDIIESSRIGLLQITGQSGGSTGDFEADLSLAGESGVPYLLQSVRITGSLNGAEWDLAGNVGVVNIGGIVQETRIEVAGDVGLVIAEALADSQILVGAEAVTGQASDFDPTNRYRLSFLYLTSREGTIFSNSAAAAWTMGLVLFNREPEIFSGTIETHQLGGAVRVPPELLILVP